MAAAPPEGSLAAPPEGSLAAPPEGSLAAPPEGSLAAPPEGSLAAPPEGSLAAPPEGSLAAPPEGSLAAPPEGSLAVPQLPQDPDLGCGKCALIHIQTINKTTASGLRKLIIVNKLDFLLITKIWQIPNNDSSLKRTTPDGYKYQYKPSGGLAVIHNKDFRFTELTFPPVESFELLAFKAICTTVLLIYRPPEPIPPNDSYGKFLVDLTELLTKASSPSTYLLILGDFNNILDSEQRLESDFTYLLEKFSLTHHVTSRAHLVCCSNLPVGNVGEGSRWPNLYIEHPPLFDEFIMFTIPPPSPADDLTDQINSLFLETKSIPLLPTILLSNVQSIKNKMDKLRAWVKPNQKIREPDLVAITETWLKKTDQDDYSITGFSGPFRQDRSQKMSGMSRGGGVCFYVNEQYCQDVVITSWAKLCNRDIELLTISLRPDDKKSILFFTVVYIHPGAKPANLAKAGQIIDTLTDRLNKIYPDAPKFVLGDFNQCRDIHGYTLKTYDQYGTFATTQNTTQTPVDRCYGSVRGAYESELKPGLGGSTHKSLYLTPKPHSGASS